MLCQDCKQRVSTVVYTEVREGTKKVLHLCQACVEKRGIHTPVLKNPLQVELLFKDMLQEMGEEGAFDGDHPLDAETCADCGWSFARFRETGLLGCPRCYTTFGEPLRDLLRRVHGSDEHLGKVYEKGEKLAAIEDNEEFLHEALEEAVEREEFEQAAAIRDRIQRLQRQDE